MSNVFLNIYKRIADGDTDLDAGTSDLRMGALTTELFQEDDVTVVDLLAAPNTKSANASDVQLTGEITISAAGIISYQADKAVFVAPAPGETLQAIYIFDEVAAADASRFLIAFFNITDTATNGGDIEIRWDSFDGVGTYMTTVNV